MNILHLFKTPPDEQTRLLATAWSEGQEVTVFELFSDEVDYDRLVDLIFQSDKVLTWF